MIKTVLVVVLLLMVGNTRTIGQDTLSKNGVHYEFIKNAADTIRSNGNTYIVKYVAEAQEADVMRSNGKIYVVVTVLATIFAGIFAYLVYLDRKIRKSEKEKNNN
jgi:CcmD family protein